MKTLKLTKADFKDDKYIQGDLEYDGHIEIDGGLGMISFHSIKVGGYLAAYDNTGIESATYIQVGWRIDAGLDIKARNDIKADLGMEVEGDIVTEQNIDAGWDISAGRDIIAGSAIRSRMSISAGRDIKSERYIQVGGSINVGHIIKTGGSILAETYIQAKDIDAGLRIFAGLIAWRYPLPYEMEIRCKRLIKGEVAYGNLILVERNHGK